MYLTKYKKFITYLYAIHRYRLIRLYRRKRLIKVRLIINKGGSNYGHDTSLSGRITNDSFLGVKMYNQDLKDLYNKWAVIDIQQLNNKNMCALPSIIYMLYKIDPIFKSCVANL